MARAVFAVTLGFVAFAGSAEARPRPNGHIRGKSFEANKTFGLGLELGEPTGLTGKYFLSADRALDFGIGDAFAYGNRDGFHVYGDYLFHPVSLASTEDFELPFFVGLGGRIWDFNNNGDDAVAFGFRVPVGISFDFNNIPLDAFIQIVPILDIYSGYRAHSIYPDLNFSIGARYWFN